jgi:hypothetical protein
MTGSLARNEIISTIDHEWLAIRSRQARAENALS